MFKRYRHHRLQTPWGVSCLVSACFYTCITLDGSVAPSHSFHRETSHLLKATPSSVFECKSKKTIHFSFLLRASYKLLRQRAKWSTQKLDLLIVSLKHNLHFSCAKKKSPSLLVTVCSETCGRFCIEICTNVSSIQQEIKKTLNQSSSFTSFLKKSLTKQRVFLF